MEDLFILLLVGVGLIVLGIYFIFSKDGIHDTSRIPVEATIVDQVSVQSTLDHDHTTPRTSVATYPIYEYTVDGTTYRVEGSVAITIFTQEKYKIGARETVKIDPSNPKRIYTHALQNGTIAVGVILIFMGVGIFTMAYLQ